MLLHTPLHERSRELLAALLEREGTGALAGVGDAVAAFATAPRALLFERLLADDRRCPGWSVAAVASLPAMCRQGVLDLTSGPLARVGATNTLLLALRKGKLDGAGLTGLRDLRALRLGEADDWTLRQLLGPSRVGTVVCPQAHRLREHHPAADSINKGWICDGQKEGCAGLAASPGAGPKRPAMLSSATQGFGCLQCRFDLCLCCFDQAQTALEEASAGRGPNLLESLGVRELTVPSEGSAPVLDGECLLGQYPICTLPLLMYCVY